MNVADVRSVVSGLEDELYSLALDLVRTPSVTGNEGPAQQHLAERLTDWDLSVDLYKPARADLEAHPAFCDDGLPVERDNLVASFGDPSPEIKAALVLNGHIDVVPTGGREQWSYEPFEGHIDSGELHGRGSCDMKGGLAAAAIAIRAAQKLGVEPHRPIRLESVIGEETGGVGTLSNIVRGYRADAAVITEPTSLAMCPVQAGALSFRLHVPGKAAHGAMREEGVSAVEKLWPVWQGLRELEASRHRNYAHPMFHAERLVAPLSIGRVEAGNWPSTVPEELIAEGRFGIFPGEPLDDARAALEQAVSVSCQKDDWLRSHAVRVEWFEGQFESGETPSDAPILAELDVCHREVTTQQILAHGVSYGSDLRLFTEHAKMPAVLYGPGDVALAHAADERVRLEEIVRVAEVLTLLIGRSLSP